MPEVYDLTKGDDSGDEPPPKVKTTSRKAAGPPKRKATPKAPPEPKTPGRKRVSLVKIAQDIGGDSSVPEASAPVTKKTPGRKVPEAAPETRKTPAKKVDVAAGVKKDGTMKKRPGRPKGSKNKPKLVETTAALKAA